MKAFDYSVIKNYKFAAAVKPLFKILALFSFKIKYVGSENLPEDGGFIIASNHICIIDPVFIYLMSKRPIHFMNKIENFMNPLMGWIYTHLNAFPVNRGHSDKSAVKYAVELIKQGYILGIFPEGTRSEDYVPHEAKTGIALIAREAKADIIPVSVYSEDKAKPFTKITVRFGERIPYESLGFGDGVKSNELKAAATLIMEDIKELWAIKHSK